MKRWRERVYERVLKAHLAELRQMAFLSGPRQVGKSTLGRTVADALLNWRSKTGARASKPWWPAIC